MGRRRCPSASGAKNRRLVFPARQTTPDSCPAKCKGTMKVLWLDLGGRLGRQVVKLDEMGRCGTRADNNAVPEARVALCNIGPIVPCAAPRVIGWIDNRLRRRRRQATSRRKFERRQSPNTSSMARARVVRMANFSRPAKCCRCCPRSPPAIVSLFQVPGVFRMTGYYSVKQCAALCGASKKAARLGVLRMAALAAFKEKLSDPKGRFPFCLPAA